MYLGIDLGLKTIGISISNSGIIASSLTTIRYQQIFDGLRELIKVINEYQSKIIVFGLPKHMNNDHGKLVDYVNKFAEELQKMTNVEIVYQDERLSTKVALKSLSDTGIKKDMQKKLKDTVAATIILQNYLDKLNNK